jgi:hypothetical protein
MGRDPQVMKLVPFQRDVFLAGMPDSEASVPAVFFRLPDGSRYLHLGTHWTPHRGWLTAGRATQSSRYTRARSAHR